MSNREKKKQRALSAANPNLSNKVRLPDSGRIEMPHYDYPIFCLKHLHRKYHTDKCSDEQNVALIKRLVTLSSMAWSDIEKAHRHGLGFEKIPRSSITAQFPPFITDDVEHLLAFRYYDMLPFLGHRDRFLFHVIFIDHSRDLYDHGN